MEKINNFIHTYQKCIRILNGICDTDRPFMTFGNNLTFNLFPFFFLSLFSLFNGCHT